MTASTASPPRLVPGHLMPADPGDPRHGTLNGYTNLACRCDRCRAANTRYCAEIRLRRRARGCPDHLHGSPNGYGNYGCRCGDCTVAWRADSRDYARRRRQAARAAR